VKKDEKHENTENQDTPKPQQKSGKRCPLVCRKHGILVQFRGWGGGSKARNLE